MEGAKRGPNLELWHACAGPLVSLPSAGTRVVYFPQGHSEQVAASTQREADAQIPSYPNLPPHLICQLHNVTLHADVETDEVYAQMTLQPTSQEKETTFLASDLGRHNRQPSEYFCKTLTASDTSTHGGFSIPRRAAEKVFPPLDFSLQPPAQEIVARDLHDNEWRFRHIYRGQPRRHLLTTGWSIFVGSKKLQTGDSVLFIRDDKGQLLIGIRHANRQPASMPLSLLSTDSMYIGILAAAAHAHSTNSRFTIFYNPRASPSEFVVPWSKYYNAVCNNMQVSAGMRFRMQFETEESSIRRHTGTVIGCGDLDPVRWPNSYWRSLKVEWDEPTAGDKQQRISLWEIEPVTTPYLVCSPSFTFRSRRPWSQALGPSSVTNEVEEVDANTRKWIKCENMDKNLSWNLYPDQIVQQLQQQRPDPSAAGRNDFYRVDETRIPHHSEHHAMLQAQGKPQQHSQMLQPYNCQQQMQLSTDGARQMSSGNSMTLKGPKENGACGDTDITLSSYTRTFQNILEQEYAVVGRGHEQETLGGGMNKDGQGWYAPERDFTNHQEQQQPVQLGHLDGYSANGNNLFSIADIDQGGGSTGLTPALGFKDTHQDHDSLHLDSRNLLFGVNIDTSAECNPSSTSESLKAKEDQNMNRIHSGDHHLGSSEHGSDEAAVMNRQQLPPRTFTKVYKTGSVGRSLDLTRLNSYSELRNDLARMFNLEGQLEDPRSGWQLVFVDNENDVLLVGDDPWEEFVSCVRCIKIMSPSELMQMNQDQLNSIQCATTRAAADDFTQQDSNGGKAL